MTKVRLIYQNNVAYVWNPDDWKTIRGLRIMGKLIGTLAALPRQDVFPSFPLALLPEETTLLIEKELALLVEFKTLAEKPDKNVVAQWSFFREKNLKEQVDVLKNERKRELESKVDTILEGKRIKLRNLSKETEAENLSRDEVLEEEIAKLHAPNDSYLAVQIFTGDPWIDHHDDIGVEWEYPTTEEEKLRYSVFKDLWEKEYYITSGGKFGANFLAYPGDPVRYHAQFIVICFDRKLQLKPTDIVAYGRLGQSVRKTVVLAYLDDDGKVEYQSIQWTGH